MTPDKEHAPALMQQAADEVVIERVAGAIWYENYGRHRPDGMNRWPEDVQGGSQELFRAASRAALRSAPTYEQGVAAGLEMAAKVADDLCMDASGFTEEEHAYGAVAKAIRALADQHKPSPAEEPMP